MYLKHITSSVTISILLFLSSGACSQAPVRGVLLSDGALSHQQKTATRKEGSGDLPISVKDIIARACNENVTDHVALAAVFKLHLSAEQGIPVYRRLLQRWTRATAHGKRVRVDVAIAAANSVIHLGNYGNKAAVAVPDLLSLTGESNKWPLLGFKAFESLLKIAPKDPRLIPVLIRALKGDSPNYVEAACKALGEQGLAAKAAVPDLVQIIEQQSSADTSCLAYVALGNIVAPIHDFTLPEAIEHLGDIESQSLEEGAAAFSTIRASKDNSSLTVSLLNSVLKERSQTYLCYSALLCIKNNGSGASPEILKELLDLASLRRTGIEPDIQNEDDDKVDSGPIREIAEEAIHSALSPSSVSALPLLMTTLNGQDLEERKTAARALCELEASATPAVPVLLSVLQEDMLAGRHENVEAYAITLSALGSVAKPAIPIICDMIRPGSRYLKQKGGMAFFRPFALHIFAKVGLPDSTTNHDLVLAELSAGLRSKDPESVFAAAELAEKMKASAFLNVPLLAAVLKSGERDGGLVPIANNKHQPIDGQPWDWENRDTLDCFSRVVQTLGELGRASIYAIPILQRYAKASGEAPLEPLSIVAKSSLSKIAQDQNQKTNSLGSASPRLVTLDQAILDRPVPEIVLPDNQAKKINIGRRSGKILILFFADTTCPCVPPYALRLSALRKNFESQGVEIAIVFSTKTETSIQIDNFVRKNRLVGPIIVDGKQELLKSLNVQRTTQSVLIDGNGILRYSGRFDDNIFKPNLVKEHSLLQAINSVLRKSSVAAGTLPESCELAY